MSDAIHRAVDICGGQTALARRMGNGTKQGHVWYWMKSGRVPAERCRAIEQATDGKVTRQDLRPDVFGPDNNGSSSSAEAG